uniref:Uncharacterized protein n=1 Tax=Rhizophora mucronata TaxID=61149 RepID=A0A2P2P5D1_RHIMU
MWLNIEVHLSKLVWSQDNFSIHHFPF